MKYRSITESAANSTFRIPPNDGNFEVRSEWTAKYDVDLFAMMPHMHLRGKDFEYRAVYPDGRDAGAALPKYDFNWQLAYETAKPIVLPKGTRIECTAHFDNSANNSRESRPDEGSEVGRPELGRDDDRIPSVQSPGARTDSGV